MGALANAVLYPMLPLGLLTEIRAHRQRRIEGSDTRGTFRIPPRRSPLVQWHFSIRVRQFYPLIKCWIEMPSGSADYSHDG